MCGIVGLHLRTPELYPRLGELLTGMLCEMGNRGSDSTGVAVYGDPIWSPPGRGGVSMVDVDVDADAVASAVSGRLGHAVDVVTVDTASTTYGAPAKNRMRRPSANQVGHPACFRLASSLSGRPGRTMAMPEATRYARRFPSGDQTGQSPRPIRRSFRPFASTMSISSAGAESE